MALIFFARLPGIKLYATTDLALGSAVLAEANKSNKSNDQLLMPTSIQLG
jgi:hypothetical protein